MGLISLSERSNEKLCKHKFSTSLGQVFAASSCFEFADLKIIKKDLEEKKPKILSAGSSDQTASTFLQSHKNNKSDSFSSVLRTK